jgi:hypothetical protein
MKTLRGRIAARAALHGTIRRPVQLMHNKSSGSHINDNEETPAHEDSRAIPPGLHRGAALRRRRRRRLER